MAREPVEAEASDGDGAPALGGAAVAHEATSYTRENRALEIRPVAPLERFRQVKVEFLEGVKGTDGGVMPPFTLTFTTGGS